MGERVQSWSRVRPPPTGREKAEPRKPEENRPWLLPLCNNKGSRLHSSKPTRTAVVLRLSVRVTFRSFEHTKAHPKSRTWRHSASEKVACKQCWSSARQCESAL